MYRGERDARKRKEWWAKHKAECPEWDSHFAQRARHYCRLYSKARRDLRKIVDEAEDKTMRRLRKRLAENDGTM